MTRRELWASALLVFVVALAVRLWAASSIVFARPEDAAYYVGVAKNLADGRGLVSDAIWSFQTPPLVFPRPAFEVWLPLPSFLYAIPMLVIGPTLWAAQVASSIVGSVVAVLAWRLALDSIETSHRSTARIGAVSLGAGLTAAVFLPLVLASVEPDSTGPFAAFALGACLLMARLVRDGSDGRTGYAADAHPDEGTLSWRRASTSRDLLLLGVLIGLAALTRNEAIWLALAWAIVAWGIAGRAGESRAREWARLVAIPAVVAAAVFAPWAMRDWLTFGSPLPGQALANAVSLQGTDIFAWQNPPTLATYLAAGPETLIALRIVGFLHNLLDVLLLLGTPVAALGLVALPWTARRRWTGTALRPLVVFAALTFAATTLLFPVATTWGTFLHAAGAVQVLLVVSAALALDRLVAAVGQRRHWTNGIPWFGPAMTIASALLLTVVLLPAEGRGSAEARRNYEAIPGALAQAGQPLETSGPVITDTPIWFATSTGHAALALPNEPPSSVADLASHFGATLVLVHSGNDGAFIEGLRTGTDPKAPCFTPLPMTHLGDDPTKGPDVTVYAIRCP